MPASRRKPLSPQPPPPIVETGGILREIYARLSEAYGAKTWHWHPDYVRGPMDVIAGAILVQHTTWQSAERALEALRAAGLLEPEALLRADEGVLIPLIRISGTPSIKARRLRAVASTIAGGGGTEAFLRLPDADLRARLLATHGIGPETADAIMLYAAGRAVFEIDAYTRRTFTRIGVTPKHDTYAAWQALFEDALPDGDATLYQRYHAYIVLHGKAICRAAPRCPECPLVAVCRTGRRLSP
jgi:endonuclease-3 related protein